MKDILIADYLLLYDIRFGGVSKCSEISGVNILLFSILENLKD